MAKKKGKAKAGLSWKKKKWLPVIAPKIFQEKQIGETFIDDPSSAIGRVLEVNLSHLSGNIRKQGTSVTLKVDKVIDNKAITSLQKIYLQNSAVKRLVRKKMTKIEQSFACKTKDNLIIRIKPLLLTRNRVNSKEAYGLRQMSRDYLISYCKNNDFLKIIDLCVNFRLQKDLKDFLGNIYPLKQAQIKLVGLEPKAKTIAEAKKEIKIEKKIRTETRHPVKKKPAKVEPVKEPVKKAEA